MSGSHTLALWVQGWLNNSDVRGGLILVLVALFILAGINKLRNISSLVGTLKRFRLTFLASNLGATTVAIFEILVGVFLLVSVGSVASLLVALAISLTYCLLLSRALLAKESFACNCVTQKDRPISASTLARAIAMATTCAGLIAVPSSQGLRQTIALFPLIIVGAVFAIAYSVSTAKELFATVRIINTSSKRLREEVELMTS